MGVAADPTGLSRLRLKNGDFLDGSFSNASQEKRISWKSPHFVEPLEFDLNAIRSIDSPNNEPRQGKGEYLFETHSGDRFWGKVLKWDEQIIQVELESGMQVSISPKSLRHLMKWGEQPQLTYSGPKSLEEWTPLESAGKWQMESGTLVSKETGARVRNNLKLPEKAQIDLRISFGKRPGFLISFGVGEQQTNAGSAFTLEFFDSKFALVRELGKKSDLHMLDGIDLKKGFVELTLFVDQIGGRAIAYSEQGKKLAEILLPAEKPEALPCILIENFNGEIRLEQLRIQPWTNQIPVDREGIPNYVVTAQGESYEGAITGVELGASWTIAKTDGQTQTLGFQDLKEVVLAPAATPVAKEDVVTVADLDKASSFMTIHLRDQTRFVGQVVSVSDSVIRFQPDAATEPVSVPVEQLIGMRGSLPDLTFPKLDGVREGQMTLEGLMLHGIVTESEKVEGGTCIHWKPKTALNAAHLTNQAKGSIDFRRPEVRVATAAAKPAANVNQRATTTATPAASTVKKASVPNLSLRTGDLVLAEIEAINEKGVTFKSTATSTTFVPNDQVQSVELHRMRRDRIQNANKMARLLTVPRMKKNDPPTHLVSSIDGDFLRGRLIGLQNGILSIEVRLEVVKIPIDTVAQIVWLHDRGWKDDGKKKDEVAPVKTSPAAGSDEFQIHAVERSGWRVTFMPQSVNADSMIGKSPLLGDCNVLVKNIDILLLGTAIGDSARELAANPWSLTLAKAPKIYEEGDAADTSLGTSSPLVGNAAPKLEGEMLSGETFKLSDMKGEVVVLDFWASWCGPCMKTMPAVDAAVSEVGGGKAKLYAVNLEEPAERAQAALVRLNLQTPVVLDSDGVAAQRFQATAIPQTVIVDRKGVVRYVFVGGGNAVIDSFKKALQEIIEEGDK